MQRVALIQPTFLRDGLMRKSVDSMRSAYPEIEIVVADNGYHTLEKDKYYDELQAAGHKVVWLPFDAGLPAAQNAAIAATDREYLLTGHDDFLYTRNCGIEQFVKLLDALPEVGVAAGRLGNIPFEANFEITADTIRDVRVSWSTWQVANGVRYQYCDVTGIWSMERRQCYNDGGKWDERYVIGGAHGDFFMDIKLIGKWKVAFTPDANVWEIQPEPGDVHPDYGSLHWRSDWQKICGKKYGKKLWISAGGVHYNLEDN
jgi:hypothetical protein